MIGIHKAEKSFMYVILVIDILPIISFCSKQSYVQVDTSISSQLLLVTGLPLK